MVLPRPSATNPDWAVASVNRPFPSFRKSAFRPPIEVTMRSRSPSPSTSANTAPVEGRSPRATPASVAASWNFQLPSLR